jgi:hypothetical protein
MTDDLLLTQHEVVRAAKDAGFGHRPARVLSAIAMCEAPVFGAETPTADFGLVGDRDLVTDVWGPSIGGFQIRTLKAERGDGTYRDRLWLQGSVEHQCQAARTIYLQRGWTAWSTYTTGMYKAYLQDLYPPPAGTYVVMAGDTLSGIAAKFGVTVEFLAILNGIHDVNSIRIGDVLQVEAA